ncbi:hypothetical protein CHS0354_006873 [Potamilus streckersoni]|uniref:SHSP domain-containing protein n=1 Tax=Potamilus streckersoni TaxID=2493646 RepID=A0AAE0TEB8_9BIVA|nr:hypothetical protein CHS0354_006873 [Potamilus streckersoni]
MTSNNIQTEKKNHSLYIKPVTDIYETENAFHLNIEMPGVEKANVDISHSNGVLTKFIRTVGGHSRKIVFERLFALGREADTDKISAALEDALLKITVPKTENKLPKTVEIK